MVGQVDTEIGIFYLYNNADRVTSSVTNRAALFELFLDIMGHHGEMVHRWTTVEIDMRLRQIDPCYDDR